jgi:hypothetical protein
MVRAHPSRLLTNSGQLLTVVSGFRREVCLSVCLSTGAVHDNDNIRLFLTGIKKKRFEMDRKT